MLRKGLVFYPILVFRSSFSGVVERFKGAGHHPEENWVAFSAVTEKVDILC